MSGKVTAASIARKLGLSPTTVSFALNGEDRGVSQATKRRIFETASAMGYSRVPRRFREGWTRVAYVSANISNFNLHTTFFSGVFNHLQRNGAEKKTEFLLFEFNPGESPEKVFIRTQELFAAGFDVFITSSRDIAEFLLRNGRKVILVQSGHKMDGCINIYCDDFAAGKTAAEHALDMGHRTAGMIFWPSVGESPRFKGFFSAFKAGGGCVPEKFIWFIPAGHEVMMEETARLSRAGGKLPTLFYCFADNLLFPVIKGFMKSGLRVPDDVSLIGADNLYWGRFANPAFTTVDLREDLFAEKVMDAVFHAKDGADVYELAVPVRLVQRETVKKMSE